MNANDFTSSMPLISTYSSSLQIAAKRLQEGGIVLLITRKRVKNINFRIKPYKLLVSAPTYVTDSQIAAALNKRLDWAIYHHKDILKRELTKQQNSQSQTLKLWGEDTHINVTDAEKIAHYRQALNDVMPSLFEKWEPIVGRHASERRIKKMSTRWGSCNTKVGRIWLSVYLPAYPIRCTEYVIVHELCHLHHANHSAAFWQTVESAMPDYKQWHDMLAGKHGVVD